MLLCGLGPSASARAQEGIAVEDGAGLDAPRRGARSEAREVEAIGDGAGAAGAVTADVVDGTAACWDASDFPEGEAPRDADATRCRRNWVEIAELYAMSGLLGFGAGAWLGDRLEAGDFAGVLGGVAAAGTSLSVYLLDSAFDGLAPGIPSAIWSGILLGTFEGVLAWSAFGNEPFTGRWSGTFYLSSAVLGALVGGLVGFGGEPTPGAAAFVRSGAMWGTWFAQMLSLAFSVADDQVDTFRTLFTGYNAGIVGAAILASVVPMSRVRTLWIDLGAAAGAFAGALLVSPDRASDRAVGIGVGLGTAAGMAVSVWLTSPSDPEAAPHDERPARASVWGGPVEGGALVGATTTF